MYKSLEGIYYRIKRRFELGLMMNRLGIASSDVYPQYLLDQLFILRSEILNIEQVVDVGANEGMFSRSMTVLFPDLVFYCIEPNKNLNTEIRKNLKSNQVTVVNELASNKVMPVTFNIHEDSQMSSILGVEENKLKKNFEWDNPEKIEKVELTSSTLDILCEQHQVDLSKKTLLKIDTQGNELDVLKGASGCLPSFHYIIVEYMFDSPYVGETSSNDLFKLLFDKGFIFSGPTMYANRVDGKIGAINFLFKKQQG